MAKLLHPKIKALKERAAPIQYRQLAVNAAGAITDEYPVSDFDNRIIAGYGSLWSSKNDYGEVFERGAFRKSIADRGPQSNAKQKIKMLNFHNQREPLALFERLEENNIGLYFRSVKVDDQDYADRTLISLRSGTVDNFSIGWNPIWEKLDYDERSQTIFIGEDGADLFEISPVSLASDFDTYCLRNKEEISTALIDLNDEIEFFIKTLPRAEQIGARQLFKRYKSLLELEPPQDEEPNALDRKRQMKSNSLTKFLIENLNK